MCSFRLALARSAVCPRAGEQRGVAPSLLVRVSAGRGPRRGVSVVSPHLDVVEKEPLGKSRRGRREGASEGVGSWASGGGSGEGLGPEPEAGKGFHLQWEGENPAGVGLQLGVASMRLRDVRGRVVRWGTSEGQGLRPGTWRCDVVTGRWVSTGDESAEAGVHSVFRSSLLGSETLPLSRCP